MCTSIISNRKKTIVGWNLDILDMEHRVTVTDAGVYIEINDAVEGWLPLFGANNRGDFVGMPTCWPFDERSNPDGEGRNIIMLDIDLLLKKKTLDEIRAIAETEKVFSVPGLTFMSSLSDKEGNVLQIVPGQGTRYFDKPKYLVLTNFSPFKMGEEQHLWMGMDRYMKAESMLENAPDDFDVDDCFRVLEAVSQDVCPTMVSMVFDVTENVVYWCENRDWRQIQNKAMGNCQ